VDIKNTALTRLDHFFAFGGSAKVTSEKRTELGAPCDAVVQRVYCLEPPRDEKTRLVISGQELGLVHFDAPLVGIHRAYNLQVEEDLITNGVSLIATSARLAGVRTAVEKMQEEKELRAAEAAEVLARIDAVRKLAGLAVLTLPLPIQVGAREALQAELVTPQGLERHPPVTILFFGIAKVPPR